MHLTTLNLTLSPHTYNPQPRTPKSLNAWCCSPPGPAPIAPEKLAEAVRIRDLLGQNTEELRSVARALNGEYILPEAGGDLLRDGAGEAGAGAARSRAGGRKVLVPSRQRGGRGCFEVWNNMGVRTVQMRRETGREAVAKELRASRRAEPDEIS